MICLSAFKPAINCFKPGVFLILIQMSFTSFTIIITISTIINLDWEVKENSIMGFI